MQMPGCGVRALFLPALFASAQRMFIEAKSVAYSPWSVSMHGWPRHTSPKRDIVLCLQLRTQNLTF